MSNAIALRNNESFWERLTEGLSSLLTELSNLPTTAWQTALQTRDSLISTLNQLGLQKLIAFFQGLIDTAFEVIQNMIRSAVDAISSLAASLSDFIVRQLPAWLSQAGKPLVDHIVKTGVQELVRESVKWIIDWMKDNVHHLFSSDWQSGLEFSA